MRQLLCDKLQGRGFYPISW